MLSDRGLSDRGLSEVLSDRDLGSLDLESVVDGLIDVCLGSVVLAVVSDDLSDFWGRLGGGLTLSSSPSTSPGNFVFGSRFLSFGVSDVTTPEAFVRGGLDIEATLSQLVGLACFVCNEMNPNTDGVDRTKLAVPYCYIL